MAVQDQINIQRNSINQKSNMLCTRATFLKKNSYLVTRIASCDTAGLHLLTFLILGPYPSKDIAIDLSDVISH